MSTLMSTDMNLKRPSSRVLSAPGGASSFTIGDASVTPVKPKPAAAAAPAPATPAPVASSSVVTATPVTVFSSVKMPVSNERRVGVAIGGMFANEVLKSAVLLALSRVGVTNIVLRMTTDAVVLPYVCKSLMHEKCDVVFAGCALDGAHDGSAQTANLLLQSLTHAGVSGSVPVVPGVTVHNDLLTARVVIPAFAAQWAAAVGDLLQLAENPRAFNQEVVIPAETARPEPALTEQTVAAADLMEVLRASFRAHGVTGIFSMGRKFRIVDDNGNGTIEFSEFKKCVSEHALKWSDAQLKAVFDSFDTDKSGAISFDEFLKGCRPAMNDRRKQIILQAFALMDVDKSGVIEASDIEAKYDASKHPDVIAGKRTAAAILREFLDTFDGSDKDGKVTPAEFMEYYSNVSASIDTDDYFELMMRNAWHISGGEGQCANSSCRRVLVNHTDGHQSVEEIKNDLAVAATDKQAMIANLVAQGISTVASIDLTGSADNTTPPVNAAAAPAPALASPEKKTAGSGPAKTDAPNPVHANSRGRFGRGSGQALGSSITF